MSEAMKDQPYPTPYFSCQNDDCAAEVSFPAGMLSVFEGSPICETCYGDIREVEECQEWSDLPDFVPEYEIAYQLLQQERDELLAQNERLRECLSDLIENSDGVAGLHLNGDISPWESLSAGGHFEEWLFPFSETPAQSLEALKAQFQDEIFNFDKWWNESGSAMKPLKDEDCEEHSKRVALAIYSSIAKVTA